MQPLTEASLPKVLWQMSWPLLVTTALSSTVGFVDMYIAGSLSPLAQAAVGLGGHVLDTSLLLGTGLSVGISTVISHKIGARQFSKARLWAWDSLYLSAALGMAALLAGFVLAKPILELFSHEATQAGKSYLELCSLGNLPLSIVVTMTAIFRAWGRPKYALLLWLIIALVSGIGSFALIRMPQGLLHNSINALAVSWDIACILACWFGFNKLPELIQEPVCYRNKKPVRAAGLRYFKLLQLALPVILGEIGFIVANFATFAMLQSVPHATQAQAAWSLALKIEETFAYMPLVALGLTASVIVGQNLGAQQIVKARISLTKLTQISVALMFISGLFVRLFANEIAFLFSRDTEVMSYMMLLLQGAPFVMPLLALSAIPFAGMEGAGCTFIPMAGNLAIHVLLRLPLCSLLIQTQAIAISGIWLGLTICRILLSAIALLCLKNNIWLKKWQQRNYSTAGGAKASFA